MKKTMLVAAFLCLQLHCFCWGFYAHKKINYYAVFLLPPEMLVLYKPQIDFISAHAADADMRRYILKEEAPRHYIDFDYYKRIPPDSIPHHWNKAVERFTQDSLLKHGIVPWWVQTMEYRLTEAFKEKNQAKILKLSADIGHYIADAHVPLHANSNYNGQFTNQTGIHAFWESRIPELLAETEWDFFIGKATYIKNPGEFIWKRVTESAAEADSVLSLEKKLSSQFPEDKKYSFEEKNGNVVRQYSSAYTKAYNDALKGMVERRMRQAIFAIASFWYTAWVNAGEPDLKKLGNKEFSPEEMNEFELLQNVWRNNPGIEREH